MQLLPSSSLKVIILYDHRRDHIRHVFKSDLSDDIEVKTNSSHDSRGCLENLADSMAYLALAKMTYSERILAMWKNAAHKLLACLIPALHLGYQVLQLFVNFLEPLV